MKARLHDFLYISPTRGRVTLDIDGDFRPLYDKFKDMDIELSVKKWHPARSLDANAYAWVLINKIAENRREPPIDVYRRYVRDVGCKTQIVCVQTDGVEQEVETFVEGHMGRMVAIGESKQPGWAVLHKMYGSSDYDTAQMAAFIDNIIQDCRELGIETRPKEEIESMLGEWK